MRTIIISLAVLFCGLNNVKAEDSISLDKSAKVGETKILITSETLADGTTWELETVCTKVARNSVSCITTDELGLVVAKKCFGSRCEVVASR